MPPWYWHSALSLWCPYCNNLTVLYQCTSEGTYQGFKFSAFQITEWNDRAEKFHEICRSVGEMFVRLTETSNRALLYDLYPYVWDVKEVLQLLDTFVNWLSTKNKRKKQKGQSFYPEDPEPWVFRGGLCGELQVCWTVACIACIASQRSCPLGWNKCIYWIENFLLYPVL